jgi:SAM-dependent methyltransferase
MSMDYSGYVDPDYLDTASRLLSAAKRRTYELMALQEGHRVLDLGCGPASDTIALAGLVGETGHVHGVDFDSEMVMEANERANAAGVAAQVVHQQSAARQPLCADIGGFSLHAAVRVEAHDRKRLEQLCRTITRPARLEPQPPPRGTGARDRARLKPPEPHLPSQA